ncbi:MAG TPA: carboxypeptidase-like regulatory domain-containing protein [Bryobacteraceae bacterium]|jgi:hypothetical protein|nr:carboxypeptidase-like regulatory domain-containing protein [Bryobacteraceae bacterium]
MGLDQVRIASPCRADWDAMQGDDRVRFCAECGKNVYNLSALTRPEAEALVTEKEGRMCVRFYQRADGSALTSDCPVGVRIKTVRVSRRIGFAFSGLLGFAAHAWAQSPAVPRSSLLELMRVPMLSGAVVDPSGGRIPNAAVELHEYVTGRKVSVKADATGQFRFSPLTSGVYSIIVQSPGFKTENTTINLSDGKPIRIELTLYVGSTGGPVMVEPVARRR